MKRPFLSSLHLGLPSALILVVLAALFRAYFLGGLGTSSPFITFFPAVMIAALLWGFQAGFPATLTSLLLADYYWMEPIGEIGLFHDPDWLAAGTFVFFGTVISAICESMHRMRARAQSAEIDARLAGQREQASLALREKEELFRSVLENSIDVIYRHNFKAGSYDYLSPSVKSCSGFPSQEAICISAAEMHAGCHPEDLPLFRGELQRCIEECRVSGKSAGYVECRYKHSDDEYRWMANKYTVIAGEDGEPLYRIGVIRDVSEPKRMEEELLKARENLERRVIERTREIEEKSARLAELNAALRATPERLIAAQEEERKRLAGELHDSVGQTLAAVKFRIEHAYQNLKENNSAATLKTLEDLLPVLQRAIEETRAIYMGLRPKVLEDFGLISTLYWYRDEYLKLYPSIHIELQVGLEEIDVPQHIEVATFRIVQEALNNIAKYAKAEWVDVTLTRKAEAIELEITDDGVGMDLDYVVAISNAKSLGLAGMKERAELTGGKFSITSVPGKGTAIRAIWPVQTQ